MKAAACLAWHIVTAIKSIAEGRLFSRFLLFKENCMSDNFEERDENTAENLPEERINASTAGEGDAADETEGTADRSERRRRDRESLKNEIIEAENGGFAGTMKLIGIGVLGGIAGALPFAVLLYVFNIFSIVLMLLCGAGTASFFFAIGHGKSKGAKTHVLLITDTVLATIISFVLTVLVYYVPKMEIPDKNAFQKLVYYFFVYAPGNLDEFKDGAIVTNEGGFNGYTILIVALIFSLIGTYAVLIALKLYKRRLEKDSLRR